MALAAIPPTALWLRWLLLGLAGDMDHIVSAKGRRLFIFKIATLPSLIAIPLIILFRIPRDWIEVFMVPAAMTVIGVAWIQAGAWRVGRIRPKGDSAAGSIAWPLGAVLFLPLIFQFLLRPGIHFY